MWQTSPGALRSEAHLQVSDTPDSLRAQVRPLAVSRSAAGTARGQYRLAGRGVDAASSRQAPRCCAWRDRAVCEGRIAQSHPDLQGAWDVGRRFDGEGARSEE